MGLQEEETGTQLQTNGHFQKMKVAGGPPELRPSNLARLTEASPSQYNSGCIISFATNHYSLSLGFTGSPEAGWSTAASPAVSYILISYITGKRPRRKSWHHSACQLLTD